MSAVSPADRVIHILAIEADPLMQSGLVTCLNRFPDLRVCAEAATLTDASQILTDRSATSLAIDLIVCGLPLGGVPTLPTDWQQVRALAPQLPLLLLAAPQERDLLAAFQSGIEGCCTRDASILELVNGIRQVATSQIYWMPEILQQLTLIPPATRSSWRDRLRTSSLAQIEITLAELTARSRDERLSGLDRSILAGRQRELNTARWLVKRLLSPAPPTDASIMPPLQLPTRSSQLVPRSTTAEIVPPSDRFSIFDRITSKLQSRLENLTPTPLEIDILKQEKKRELLYLILQQFEGLLAELRFSQTTISQLPAKQFALLEDLWISVTTDFFGRYQTVAIADLQIEIVPTLLQDRSIVSTEILAKIPQPIELLNYLLFQQPLTIDNQIAKFGTPAAEQRACELLENLAISIANAVMQPLLNRFADLEAMKNGFYDRRLLSSREIERFRNDLSWRYRIERNLGEPQAIFESCYRLFVFTDYGIERIAIYAPRPEELARLAGIPLTVTLVLETRDAIVPRLRSATTFIGSGVVYLLTEIIGRGIGLIGRGIIKGIGNIWQESNRSRRE